MPENDFIKYEMNYRQLGKVAAETLIRRADEEEAGLRSEGWRKQILESSGFRDWYSNIIVPKSRKPLNVITLDSPEAYIMRNFSRLYTKKTGIDVNICIYSYDEIYEAFNTLNQSSNFDVLRLDVTWLSWFAEKLLMPLTDIDPAIGNSLGDFLDGTLERYARVHGRDAPLHARQNGLGDLPVLVGDDHRLLGELHSVQNPVGDLADRVDGDHGVERVLDAEDRGSGQHHRTV